MLSLCIVFSGIAEMYAIKDGNYPVREGIHSTWIKNRYELVVK
jgi:hypothetical protein